MSKLKNKTKSELIEIIESLEMQVQEFKSNEYILLGSEEKFTKTFNSSPSPMIISEIETGNIIDVNKSFTNMIMYSREELIGKNVLELNLWANPKDREKYIKKMRDDKGVSNLEIDLRTKSGDIIATLIFGEILTIKDKPYLLTSGTDITERKKAEKALKQSEEKYRGLFEAESDAIFLIENETGNIIESNKAAEKLYGYTKKELAKKSNADLSAEPGKTQNVTEQVSPQKEDIVIIPLRYHKKRDGSLFPVEITGRFFNWKGKPVHIAAIRDITERKQAELALSESEEKFSKSFFDNPTPMIILNVKTGDRIDVNNSYVKMSGYDRNELLEGNINKKNLAFSQKRLKEIIRKTIKKGYVLNEYFQFVNKTGEIFTTLLSGTKLNIGDGNKIVYSCLDVTEREETQRKLKESEEKFRRLAENSPDIIYRYRLQSNPGFEYISPAVIQISGYTPEDHYNDPELGFKIIHPDDRTELEKLLKGGFLEKPHISRWGHRDGRTIWIEDKHSPIYDAENNLIAVEGVARDITERKNAEEALRESERKFREMADLLPQIVYETDSHGDLVFVNKQAYIKFGYSEDDLKNGFNVLRTIVPEDRNRAQKNMLNIMNGEQVENTEYTLCKKNSSTFPAEIFSSPVMKDNKPVGLRGIIIDMTERKLAENKIKESQQRLSSHLNNTPLGSIFWDIDFKVIEWNSSAEQIFGYSKEEALGKHPYKLIVPKEIQGQIDDVFNHLLTQTGGTRSVNENVTKGGKRILCDWYNVVITDLDGKVTGVASLVDDITERKEIERKLKESRNQLRSLAERLQMIREEERAIVSREIHDDLGQTLTALKMDISWMKKNSGMTEEMRASKMDVMLGLTDSAIQTVKRIATELRPGILDDLGLVSAIEWQTKEFQNRSGIKCNFEIMVDEFTIEDEISIAVFRIFQESLTNIARHSQATKVEVTIKKASDFLLVEISDNGVGISEEQINSSKSLGLIGMNERVSVFRGKLTISREANGGTVVRVYIPIVRAS